MNNDGTEFGEVGAWWYDAHPTCEACGERGCPDPTCGHCDLDGIVQLTDGLIFHPLCLVKAQTEDAAFGNVEYRRAL